MFKKIAIISLITVVISYYFGDKSSELITCLFNTVIYSNELPITAIQKNLLSKEELKLYNGIEKPELYLAILGTVFDVTKGAKHYGPNQQYNVFIGRDASRSFITGKFNVEDVSDKVDDFTNEDLLSLNHWLKFYNKEYRKVGKLIGQYYDEKGYKTAYGEAVKVKLKQAQQEKEKSDLEKTKFPSCNVEWSAETGTRVWCSEKSGGVLRDWIGVPRQLYEPGSKSYRCACINEHNEKLGSIKEYKDCDKKAVSCNIKI